jgi:ABC-type amino acid transport substrate-binding protein
MTTFQASIATIMGLVFASVPPGTVQAESILDKVQSAGTIRLGVKTDYPPFAYLDAEQKYVGFDVDLWNEFAKELGAKIEYVPITSQSRIPLLTNGAIDAVSGGTAHTVEREAVVDCSITYFRTGQRFLVKKGSGISGTDDLEKPRRVGVVQGANSGPNFLKTQPQGELVVFQEYLQAILALKQNKIEVILDQFAGDDLLSGTISPRSSTECSCVRRIPNGVTGSILRYRKLGRMAHMPSFSKSISRRIQITRSKYGRINTL